MIWMIGLAGSLGAAMRFSLGQVITNRVGTIDRFPIATWIINITGSFALGLLTNLHEMNLISSSIWLIGGVGFCGAYTTLSTFGYEAMTLIQTNKLGTAILYISTSIILGLLFTGIGMTIRW